MLESACCYFYINKLPRCLRRGSLFLSKGYPEERNGLFDTLELHKIESLMCVLLSNGSHIMGAMYVDSLKRPDGFRRHDLLTLLEIAQRVALAVQFLLVTVMR